MCFTDPKCWIKLFIFLSRLALLCTKILCNLEKHSMFPKKKSVEVTQNNRLISNEQNCRRALLEELYNIPDSINIFHRQILRLRHRRIK